MRSAVLAYMSGWYSLEFVDDVFGLHMRGAILLSLSMMSFDFEDSCSSSFACRSGGLFDSQFDQRTV